MEEKDEDLRSLRMSRRPLELTFKEELIEEEEIEEEKAIESINNPFGPSIPAGEAHADNPSYGMEYVVQNWTDPFGRDTRHQNGDGAAEEQSPRAEDVRGMNIVLIDKETQTDMTPSFPDFRWGPVSSDRSQFMQGCVFGMKMVKVVEQMAANGTPPREVLEELCKTMEPRGQNKFPAAPPAPQTRAPEVQATIRTIEGPSAPNELAQVTSRFHQYQQIDQQIRQVQQNLQIYQTFFQVQLKNQTAAKVQKPPAPKPAIAKKRREKSPENSTSSDSESDGEGSEDVVSKKKAVSKTKKASRKRNDSEDTSDEEFVAPKSKKDRKKIVANKWKNVKKRQAPKRRRIQTDFYKPSF